MQCSPTARLATVSQAIVVVDVQDGVLRAVPRCLETYPSLRAAFAAPQPRHNYGVQTHGSTLLARVRGEGWQGPLLVLARKPFPPRCHAAVAQASHCTLPHHCGPTIAPSLQVAVKTPGSQKVSDTNLPPYQHPTDLALVRDVAVLWRALDDSTPEHASFTLEKARRWFGALAGRCIAVHARPALLCARRHCALLSHVHCSPSPSPHAVRV